MRSKSVARFVLLSCTLAITAGCGATTTPNNRSDHPDLSPPADASAPTDLTSSPFSSDLPPPANCPAGQYNGSYEGNILVGGLVPTKTHGTIALTLSSGGGEFSTVMNGMLTGMASDNPYSATVVGTLDCTQLKLTGGMLNDGLVTISGIPIMFQGPLTADYDPSTSSFVNGTWNIKETPTPTSTGSGTWTATLM